MLLDILPEDVATEVRDRKHRLNNVDKVIQYIHEELSRYRDREISNLQDKQAEKLLESAAKNPINSFVEVEDKVQLMMNKIENLVTAFNTAGGGGGGGGSSLPKPDPRFEGCWHCGSKDHTRRKCPQFLDLIKKNGNKLPKNYTGAYERFMKKRGQTVAMTFAKEDCEAVVCSLCQDLEPPKPSCDQCWAFQAKHQAPPSAQTEVANSFTALPVTRNDPEDDQVEFEVTRSDPEDDMLMALTQLAGTKVKFSKTPLKKKKAFTMKQIAAIAEEVNTGKIKLPDLTLDSNEEWEALWALVDSGSSVHVVDMATTFPSAKVKKPHPRAQGFKVADGSHVPDRGSAELKARTQEGDNLTINWKNAPVAMPILSTNLLSKGGKAVWYHENGGSIVNPQASTKSDFVESGGVYFINILVPGSLTQKPQPQRRDERKQQPGFVRQGAAA